MHGLCQNARVTTGCFRGLKPLTTHGTTLVVLEVCGSAFHPVSLAGGVIYHVPGEGMDGVQRCWKVMRKYPSTPSDGTALSGHSDVAVCYRRINHFVVNVS